ncbi:hypothetical protein [Ectobacillus ponti]|uniref:Uncharacterized protein n=1 Tax=Ectobacillus ponti TaxID=2961894 RepID=A0AA41X916_9BACI|nr:hypothetical protein [Ectobacillus ponti]MCP8969110.1 hypothetical protein [Ectobacillus ponti]
MIHDAKFSVWNETLRLLQQRFTRKSIASRTSFEQEELLPFLQKREYQLAAASIPELAPHRFAAFAVFAAAQPGEKLGTLILEYKEEDDMLDIEQLYFV